MNKDLKSKPIVAWRVVINRSNPPVKSYEMLLGWQRLRRDQKMTLQSLFVALVSSIEGGGSRNLPELVAQALSCLCRFAFTARSGCVTRSYSPLAVPPTIPPIVYRQVWARA